MSTTKTAAKQILEMLQDKHVPSDGTSVAKVLRRPIVPEPILNEIAILIELCQDNESRLSERTVALVQNVLALAVASLLGQIECPDSLNCVQSTLGSVATLEQKACVEMDHMIDRIKREHARDPAAAWVSDSALAKKCESLSRAYTGLAQWALVAATAVGETR